MTLIELQIAINTDMVLISSDSIFYRAGGCLRYLAKILVWGMDVQGVRSEGKSGMTVCRGPSSPGRSNICGLGPAEVFNSKFMQQERLQQVQSRATESPQQQRKHLAIV